MFLLQGEKQIKTEEEHLDIWLEGPESTAINVIYCAGPDLDEEYYLQYTVYKVFAYSHEKLFTDGKYLKASSLKDAIRIFEEQIVKIKDAS